jgi:hypothetical protein
VGQRRRVRSGRLHAQKTNVSDLIQVLSDLDPSPWAGIVGLVLGNICEVQEANNAEQLLTSRSRGRDRCNKRRRSAHRPVGRRFKAREKTVASGGPMVGNQARGALRVGVDFYGRPGSIEDEEVRRAAYDLARSIDTDIDFASQHARLTMVRPDLAGLSTAT